MSTNIDNTRKGYKAFAEGDLATLTELIAPDCVWHVGGRSQLTGDYTGHDEIFSYFGKLMELTDGTFRADLAEVHSGRYSTLEYFADNRMHRGQEDPHDA